MSVLIRRFFLIILFFYSVSLMSQVGVGTKTPSVNAMLDISSQVDGAGDFLGLMPPRIPSQLARDGITTNIEDKGMIVYVESTGCLDIFNGEFWEHMKCASEIPTRTDVWINEIHYSNTGADSGEFVEIAGVAGLDINGYSIVLYNGNDMMAYDTAFFTGLITNDTGNGFGFAVINYPPGGIQNGTPDPDGLALVNPAGKVIQFLSYGGAFTATDGVASDIVSINIGVEEDGTAPVGESLQLTGGPGSVYADFTWSGSTINTAGTINNGQVFN